MFVQPKLPVSAQKRESQAEERPDRQTGQAGNQKKAEEIEKAKHEMKETYFACVCAEPNEKQIRRRNERGIQEVREVRREEGNKRREEQRREQEKTRSARSHGRAEGRERRTCFCERAAVRPNEKRDRRRKDGKETRREGMEAEEEDKEEEEEEEDDEDGDMSSAIASSFIAA